MWKYSICSSQRLFQTHVLLLVSHVPEPRSDSFCLSHASSTYPYYCALRTPPWSFCCSYKMQHIYPGQCTTHSLIHCKRHTKMASSSSLVLLAAALVALASWQQAIAYDPSPLQDFCVLQTRTRLVRTSMHACWLIRSKQNIISKLNLLVSDQLLCMYIFLCVQCVSMGFLARTQWP